MLTRLDHITIAVRDLDAAQRSTIALLGRTPCWQGAHPEHGARGVIFRLKNTCIELRAAESAGSEAEALESRLEAKGEGLFGLTLKSEDIDETRHDLEKLGFTLEAPARGLSQDGPSGAWRRFKTLDLPQEETGGIRLSIVEHLSLPEELPASLPIGDESGTIGALDHVVVITQDADRARSLYGDRLGIRLALDKSFEDRRSRILFFRLGGATIEVGASLDPPVDPAPDQLWGLAYQVGDIDLARKRILEAGFDVSDVRKGFKPDTRVCTAKGGTHGVATLLIEPRTALR